VPVGVTGHRTQRPRGQAGPPGPHPAQPSSSLDPGDERRPISPPLAPLIAQLVLRRAAAAPASGLVSGFAFHWLLLWVWVFVLLVLLGLFVPSCRCCTFHPAARCPLPAAAATRRCRRCRRAASALGSASAGLRHHHVPPLRPTALFPLPPRCLLLPLPRTANCSESARVRAPQCTSRSRAERSTQSRAEHLAASCTKHRERKRAPESTERKPSLRPAARAAAAETPFSSDLPPNLWRSGMLR
jgi:hypothetical protein